MADLECRLPCGCRFWSIAGGLLVGRTACDTASCLGYTGRGAMLRFAAIGYAIAASRGVGPWANRRTR